MKLAVLSSQEIDKKLRWHANQFDHAWVRMEPMIRGLQELITEAKAREIHKDLGYKSWTAYMAHVARTEMANIARSVEPRRQVLELLAGEGMSNRAIAEAVGVSHPTVIRDRAATEVVHDVPPEPATVTGRDGKTYPKPIDKVRDGQAGPMDQMTGVVVKARNIRRNLQDLLTMVVHLRAESDTDIRDAIIGQIEPLRPLIEEIERVAAGESMDEGLQRLLDEDGGDR